MTTNLIGFAHQNNHFVKSNNKDIERHHPDPLIGSASTAFTCLAYVLVVAAWCSYCSCCWCSFPFLFPRLPGTRRLKEGRKEKKQNKTEK